MDPINYSVDVATPFQAALQGYNAGAAIRNDQLQQQQQQAALAQQQKQQQLLAGLAANPNATADDYASVMTQIPALAEHLQKAWTTKNTAQQQSHAADLLKLGAAIKSGNPDIASDLLIKRAEAIENSGGNGVSTPTRESQALRDQAQAVKEHPEFALGQIQAMLAANPNGKDAAESLSKFGTEQRAQELQPSAVATAAAGAAKARSDATKAAVDAKYAEPQAIKDLELKGWNVENIKSEIGYRKEQNRIAAMTAALGKETNDLKRQELGLKIQETQQALTDKINEKKATVQSGAASIDNLINTVDRLKQNAGLKDVIGSLEGADYYPTQLVAGVAKVGNLANPLNTPSSGDDRADAIALIDTIKSQAFLAQAQSFRGMGALSDSEGKKLETALQSLNRRQSEKQFGENLDEIQRLSLKARKAMETRYGIKAGTPDTPAVQTSPADIDALVKKYGD